jgi:hypothetical protein
MPCGAAAHSTGGPMGFADVVVMILIISGAFYLLYRSVWKKQGYCSGCDTGACSGKGINKRTDCH